MNYWNLNGEYIGKQYGIILYDKNGKPIGVFYENELYDFVGNYLGEIFDGNRIIVNLSHRLKQKPRHEKPCNCNNYYISNHNIAKETIMYLGVEDFYNE